MKWPNISIPAPQCHCHTSPAWLRERPSQLVSGLHKLGHPNEDGGHVIASRATDPGLVYNLTKSEYECYICGLFGKNALENIAHDPSLTCSEVTSIPEAWLNLSTIMVPLKNTTFMLARTLTNVGPIETY
jgi:hypothetical protein